MKKILLSLLAVFSFLALSSQTNEQAAEFINKTHIAINKLQKEMIRLGDQNITPSLKEAIKFQVAAVKSYKAGNSSEAFTFSYYSRNIITGSFKEINQTYADYFTPTDSDEKFVEHSSGTKNYNSLLNKEEVVKIENTNYFEPQKLREFEINLN